MHIVLNEAQTEAVTHIEGPCLVLAGPGSGKTAVITYRVKYLIEQAGILPEQILVITYTKAAALEMEDRFAQIMQGADIPCTFGTFHSIFFRILRRAYGYTGEQVLPEECRRAVIKEILQTMELEYEDEEEVLRGLISEITLVKSECIELQHYYSTTCGQEEFRYIFESYENWLRTNNKIDFDDMLVYTYELLRERKDICRMWQNKYRYILIDEFQDINRIQYEIVRLLAGERQNLFIVGDDDQSIYRFRGARPEIMLGFQEDYKRAKKIVLNVNYRSSREIVEGSLRLVENNQRRYAKKIQSDRDYVQPIFIHEMKSDWEESESIVRQIREYHAQGIPYREMAVIYRTNQEPGRLVQKLLEYNLPFQMRDKLPNCYEHWIAKQWLAYARIAMGSRDREDFLQIWNRPTRYLRREWLTETQVDFNKIAEQVKEKPWAVEQLRHLSSDILQLKTMKPAAAIRYIRKTIGYDRYIEEYAKQRNIGLAELTELEDELEAMAQPFPDYLSWFQYIEEYRIQLKEQEKRQKQYRKQEDALTLTTMHSAKGLEFQAVFLPNANEGITPYKKAVKPEELEEERRMFYVAITRAKTYLHIYLLRERHGKKLNPSRFVNELRFDRKKLCAGSGVRHRKYGIGIITYADKEKITIYFEESKKSKTFSVEVLLQQGMLSC